MIDRGSTVMRPNPLTHLFAIWRDPLASGRRDDQPGLLCRPASPRSRSPRRSPSPICAKRHSGSSTWQASISRDVCLDYPLYGAYDFSLKRRLLGRLFRQASEMRSIRAVDNISIEAKAGARDRPRRPERLRQIDLAAADRRRIPGDQRQGRDIGNIVPLLGLGAGVNLDFVAADNINLLLRISGRKPTPAILEEIWAFTELEERMQRLPLRMFSSGMLMRVLFATATAFPADILLLDEWLSVVDENFSAKAERRLRKMVETAAVVIIASHDHALLRRTCTSIINLDHGRIASTVALDTLVLHHLELREISA